MPSASATSGFARWVNMTSRKIDALVHTQFTQKTGAENADKKAMQLNHCGTTAERLNILYSHTNCTPGEANL